MKLKSAKLYNVCNRTDQAALKVEKRFDALKPSDPTVYRHITSQVERAAVKSQGAVCSAWED